MVQPPIDHPLNLTTQTVLLYGSWALTLAVLAVSARMGFRERTPFYSLMALAVLVGAFVEPLYDEAFMLYFYSTKGMVTHFTAFGIPQPVWTHSGYVVLYAAPAIVAAREAWRGTLSQRRLWTITGITLLMSCAFEMFGITAGAYTYWGPHTWRILNYPLVIGVLETAQVMVFAITASVLRTRVSHPTGLVGLFVLFPCTFLAANLGAGWPVIIAIHLDNPSTLSTVIGTLLSILLATQLIRAAANLTQFAAQPTNAQPDSTTTTAAVLSPTTPGSSSAAVAARGEE